MARQIMALTLQAQCPEFDSQKPCKGEGHTPFRNEGMGHSSRQRTDKTH